MKTLGIFAVWLITGTAIQAGEDIFNTRARIEINGGREVPLTPVSGPEGGELRNFSRGTEKPEDGPEFNLIGHSAPLSEDDWATASFSFLPENSGRVTVYLKGNWARAREKTNLDARWVHYKLVAVDGADQLQNADFEEATAGMPDSWKCTSDVRYITNGMKEFSGKAMVAVWHNQYCSQSFPVIAGQQVTITLHIKMGEVQLAEK